MKNMRKNTIELWLSCVIACENEILFLTETKIVFGIY